MYTLYRIHVESILDVGTTVSGIPYMLSLASFSIGMFITSQYVTINHMKRYIYTGISLFTVGLFLSAWMPHILVFSISYGVMMGLGVGAIYGIALMVVSLQDLKRKGLFSGLMLFFFGASSALLAPFASAHILSYGLQSLFYVYFLIALVLSIILSAYTYVMPKIDDSHKKGVVKPWGRMFTLMTLMTLITLTMIGLTGKIAIEYYGYNPVEVSFVVSLFALLNALARPIFGYLSDKIGFIKSGNISIFIVFIATIINILNEGLHPALFFIGYGMYWFTLGSWLSLMPLLVLKTYGYEAHTKTYGFVYLGYGLGAVIGTLMSSYMLEFFSNPMFIYIILGIVLIPAYYIFRKIGRSDVVS